MSDWSSSGSSGVSNTSKSYKKSFNQSHSILRNRVTDAYDNLAIDIFKKKTNCLLCTKYLVMTTRNSCCSKCFIEWMKGYDSDDVCDSNIIKCRKCARPINTVLNSHELDMLCELVELGEKKRAGLSGHFGYPVLSSEVMDMLFEGLESDSKSNITD